LEKLNKRCPEKQSASNKKFDWSPVIRIFYFGGGGPSEISDRILLKLFRHYIEEENHGLLIFDVPPLSGQKENGQVSLVIFCALIPGRKTDQDCMFCW
jgi:hypothetical protein